MNSALRQCAAASTASVAIWDSVKRYMIRHCGVVLSDEQIYLLEPRLAPVAKEQKFSSLGDFVDAAEKSAPTSAIGMALIEAMTTHETMFFRDAPFWRGLDELVLPRLIKEAAARPLRIWSAACSTGQEPYSLAMLLDERYPAIAANAEILATDISAPTVTKAESGLYSVLEVNRGVGAVRLSRHFQQAPGGFRISDRLRARIRWSTHNLLGGAPDYSSCDLVLCRNVLIYFCETDRAAAVQRLFAATRSLGVVGVGSTESIRGRSPVAPGLYTKTPI